MAKYKRMGELAFCKDQGRLAREWIAQNPGRFAEISLKRVYYFWNGIPRLSNIPWLAETKNTHYLLLSVVGNLGIAAGVEAARPRRLSLRQRSWSSFRWFTIFVSRNHDTGIRSILSWSSLEFIWFPSPKAAPATTAVAQELTELDQDPVPEQFHTLSVIIPVYNERPTVMKLLRQVARQPLSLQKELVIVDDFSTDGTREFLRDSDLQALLGGNGANIVKLVLHEKNMGKGAGVRTGLKHSTGELVIIQDADLEYDPRDYPGDDHSYPRRPRRRGLRQPLPLRLASRAALLALCAEPHFLHRCAIC